ncbi:MAG: hypothetical protein ACRDOJ_02760 [Nocardioidaceae bacterium]
MLVPDRPPAAGAIVRDRLETLERLWPGSASEVVGWSRQAPDTLRRDTRHWSLVSARGGAQILVPDSPSLRRAALRGFGSVGMTDRARGAVAGFMHRGQPLVLTRHVTITSPSRDPSIEAHLSDVLGRPVSVAVWLDANQGDGVLILQVLDDAADTVAFAKVATTPRSRELVRAEAQALKTLAGVRLTHVSAPASLYHGGWQGLEVMVETPLLSRSRRRGDSHLMLAAMREVSLCSEVTVEPLVNSRYLARLQSRLESLRGDEANAMLHRALGELVRASGNVPWWFGSWHGDLTAGDAPVGDDGRLQIWGWRHFTAPVPCGFDALHRALHASLRRVTGGRRAVTTLLDDAARALRGWSVPAGQQPMVVLAYLVDIGARYLRTEQSGLSGPVPPLHTWLLPPLARETQRLSNARPSG